MSAPLRPIESYLNRTAIEGDCLVWQGAVSNSGYPKVRRGGHLIHLHRVIFEHYNGPIPQGLVVDHACHNDDGTCSGRPGECRHRLCLRVDHMRATTRRENTLSGKSPTAINARKELCPNGHPLAVCQAPSKRGQRWCPTCQKIRNDARRRIAEVRWPSDGGQ